MMLLFIKTLICMIAMANLGSNARHNVCAYLDPTTKQAQSYADIIAFLLRSRIYYAISTRHDAFKSHQQLFWRSAVLDEDVDPLVIKGNIQGKEISISVADIRRVLRFGEEPEGVIQLNKYLVRGCFLRMKYNGDINEGNLSKAHLCPQFKYLMHVIMHCLGSRKGGFDNIREILQSAMVALVLNRPYNFSAMIFHHLVENLSKEENKKFLMYPRFLQMILDDKLPNLPKADADKMVFEHMTDMTLNRLHSYRGKDDKPLVKRLFGHLSRVDYIAPPNKRWRNDDSDSDVEDIIIPDDDDDQDGDNVGAQLPQPPQANPEEQPPKQPVAQTEPVIEQQLERIKSTIEPVEIESEERDSDEEFEHIVEGSRLITKKRRLESSHVGSSIRLQDKDIVDADFIPGFSGVHADDIPAPTSPPKKKAIAETSKGKGKEKQRKKKRFVLARQNPVSPQIQQVSQAMTSAATPSVSVPMSTAAIQTNVPFTQAFARLNEAFGGPSVMSTSKKKARAETSKGKGKEKQRKRKRFVLVRRNPVSPQIQQVSQIMTSAAATPSVSVPMSTATVQTNVPFTQDFSRLNEAFGGPSVMSINTTTSTTSTGIQTPVTIIFSPLPATVAGESSSTSTHSLQEQINNLNIMVQMLLDKCTKNEKQTDGLTKSNQQLQLTVGDCSKKIVKLEEENLKLKTTVDELANKIHELEGGEDEDVDQDDYDDDCDIRHQLQFRASTTQDDMSCQLSASLPRTVTPTSAAALKMVKEKNAEVLELKERPASAEQTWSQMSAQMSAMMSMMATLQNGSHAKNFPNAGESTLVPVGAPNQSEPTLTFNHEVRPKQTRGRKKTG